MSGGVYGLIGFENSMNKYFWLSCKTFSSGLNTLGEKNSWFNYDSSSDFEKETHFVTIPGELIE